MFLSVDGERFRICTFDTSQGAHRRRFLALMVGAPESPALAPHREVVVDVCYVDGVRFRISVSISQGSTVDIS
jgi:hypothetical protein